MKFRCSDTLRKICTNIDRRIEHLIVLLLSYSRLSSSACTRNRIQSHPIVGISRKKNDFQCMNKFIPFFLTDILIIANLYVVWHFRDGIRRMWPMHFVIIHTKENNSTICRFMCKMSIVINLKALRTFLITALPRFQHCRMDGERTAAELQGAAFLINSFCRLLLRGGSVILQMIERGCIPILDG